MSGGTQSQNDPQKLVANLVTLLKEDAVDQAAKLYSRLSEDVGYYLVQKLVAAQPNLSTRIAKMFFLAKDYEKAALVFEQAGEFLKAAKLFEKADDYGMAAEMYAKSEAWEQAAQMYEKHTHYGTAAELYQKIGDLNRAAANFEKAVNHFRAGKTYFQLGKHEKAIELLQKIVAEDPNYLEAAAMINDLLAAGGYRAIAIRKLTALIEDRGLTDETLDLALKLAEHLYAERDMDRAKSWIARILEIRFPYKHAGELLKKIESGQADIEEVAEAAHILDDDGAPTAPVPAAAVAASVPAADSGSVPAARPAAAASGSQPPSPPAEEVLDDLEPIEDTTSVMALDAGFETIRDARLFQELNLQELKKFWNLVERRSYPPEQVLIDQGVAGQGLYVLSGGNVEVARIDPSGKAEILAKLTAGAHLGEMTLLDDSPTSARVRALDEVQVFFMPKATFQQLIDSDDRLARKIYQAFAATLMDRLRETNERFQTFKSKQQREMADLFGLKG